MLQSMGRREADTTERLNNNSRPENHHETIQQITMKQFKSQFNMKQFNNWDLYNFHTAVKYKFYSSSHRL